MTARGVLVLLAALAALLAATGCGGSDGGEVTVQTGDLSKAEFVEKADAVCEAARAEFLAKYGKFLSAHQGEPNDSQTQEKVLGELVESILAPNMEGEISRIGKLGAPEDFAPEVDKFLSALQQRLDEGLEDPRGLTATPTPFIAAETVARKAGMKGCSESFS